MKHKDTVTPYIMASMHPIMHLALLTSGIILISMDNDKFYEVPNEESCSADDVKATRFIKGDKFFYVGLMGLSHLLAIVFHYLNDLLMAQDKKILGNLFMVFKIFFYLIAVFKTQGGIIFKSDCRKASID